MPVRIYDISKKLGLDNKQVLAKAKALNLTAARVASSSLDKITAEYLEEQLILEHPECVAPPPPPPAPPPSPSAAPPAAPPPAAPPPQVDHVGVVPVAPLRTGIQIIRGPEPIQVAPAPVPAPVAEAPAAP